MKIVGIMPVRNEQWILGLSARVALKWCDELVILDHASTDHSRKIVSEISSEMGSRDCIARVTVQTPEWDEMTHRQMMLEVARRRSATHIAIIDADELLTANLLPSIRSHVEQLPPRVMLTLPGYNLRSGIKTYHSNGVWGNRWFSTVFCDDARANWNGDMFHHREPHGVQWKNWRPINQGDGGVLHFWGADERRLMAKHALYKITERIRWPEKPKSEIEDMYNLWRARASDAFATVPAPWIADYKDLMRDHLDLNQTPWQEAQCRRLIEEYGPEPFTGLDLFGVV